MSSTMTVIGVALREHGHDLSSVSFTISVHFLGMFGLVLVVGYLVDRIGRRRSMAGGLFILATGVAALAAGTTFGTVLPAMFAVGVGWNVAFVAATALMADATQPHERARLLGFGDLLAAGTAAAGTIGAGAILNWAGLPGRAQGTGPVAHSRSPFALEPSGTRPSSERWPGTRSARQAGSSRQHRSRLHHLPLGRWVADPVGTHR
jgi:MFS family permease